MSEEEDRLDGAALAGLMVAAEKICVGHRGPHPFTTTPEDRQALRKAIDAVERRFFDVLAVGAAIVPESGE